MHMCMCTQGRGGGLDSDGPVGRGAEEAPLGEPDAAVGAGAEEGGGQAHEPAEAAVEDQAGGSLVTRISFDTADISTWIVAENLPPPPPRDRALTLLLSVPSILPDPIPHPRARARARAVTADGDASRAGPSRRPHTRHTGSHMGAPSLSLAPVAARRTRRTSTALKIGTALHAKRNAVLVCECVCVYVYVCARARVGRGGGSVRVRACVCGSTQVAVPFEGLEVGRREAT